MSNFLLGLLIVAVGLILFNSRTERMTNPSPPATATPPPATPPAPATGETPDSLRARYNRLQDEYETLLQSSSPDMTALRRKNFEMERTINELLEVHQQSSWQTNQEEIDRLREILRRIQRDYNGLAANTDQLETLRRIRQGQEESVSKPVNAYIALLLASAVLLVGTLFITSFWSSSSSPPVYEDMLRGTTPLQSTVADTPAMTSNPAATATLPQMDEYSGTARAF